MLTEKAILGVMRSSLLEISPWIRVDVQQTLGTSHVAVKAPSLRAARKSKPPLQVELLKSPTPLLKLPTITDLDITGRALSYTEAANLVCCPGEIF